MDITIIHEELETMPELIDNDFSPAGKAFSSELAALAETRIVIENQGQQHVRIMRLSRDNNGMIEIEHRDTENIPFQVRIERG